ncbi:MAG: TolC family protein [Candidatus Zophobacter franzmannii]|nr:TolC family protein [Candidatus Zophobacter franzmannii]
MKYLITILLLLSGLLIHAQEVEKNSLEYYQQLAIQNNPSIAYADSEIQIAKQKTISSGAWSDPSINAGWAIAPVETKNGALLGKVGVRQMLPKWGVPGLKRKAAKYISNTASLKYQDSVNKLSKEVAISYYKLYLLEAKSVLFKKQLKNLELLETNTITGFENDIKTLSDVLDIQIAQMKLKQQYDNLIEMQISAQYNFNLLIGQKPEHEIILPDSLSLPTDIQLRTNDLLQLESHPLILAIAEREKANVINSKVQKRNKLPSLGLGVEYSFIEKQGDGVDAGKDAIMASISLSIPWQRKALNSKVKEAELRVQQAQLEHEKLQLTLQQSYLKFDADMKTAEQTYTSAIAIGQKLSQILALTTTAFENGESTFGNVLVSDNKLVKNRISQAEALVKYLIAKAELDYLITKGTK